LILHLFSEIKELMYNQKQEEGAWLQSYLTIYPNGEYEYSFNYDNDETLNYFASDPSELKSEFETYPRKKEFTPEWWQKILGKKVKYLSGKINGASKFGNAWAIPKNTPKPTRTGEFKPGRKPKE
jgi:hypothetical protein